jgi:formylglycine-generating enzyme required for sulfatase activity
VLPANLVLKGGEVVEVEIAKGVKMTFCWVPAGESQLGSPKAERLEVLKLIMEFKDPEYLASEAEEIRGKFKTKGYWMAKFPVTQEQWQSLMGNNPSTTVVPTHKEGITDTSRFPVDTVSWDDCHDFLKKLKASVKVPEAMGQGKFVLPSENEWEYAARGGKGNKQAFYFGKVLKGDMANCDGTYPFGTVTKGPYLGSTTEVGSYEKLAPHPWGLCDMHGNVHQWCDDLYTKGEVARVVRGGSWNSWAVFCRSAFHDGVGPGTRRFWLGFRVCFRLD